MTAARSHRLPDRRPSSTFELQPDYAVADLLPPCACARDVGERWERGYPPPLQRQRATRQPTPQATIEAILHGVRQRGVAALKEPAQVERLSRCDAAAKAEIDKRIAKLLSKERVR